MDKNEAFRTEIENRIIAKLKEITIRDQGKDAAFIDFDMMEDFIEECQSLVEYFQQFADTTMGVEIANVYVKLTRYFQYLTMTNSNEEIKEQARRWLDDITNEAGKNWDRLHPKE